MARQHSKKRTSRPKFRTNRQIRVPEIRLVGDNLEEVSRVAGKKIDTDIYPTRQAQKWADELGLDLVEISAKANPPVCKIIDFNKFLYDKKKREKENKAKT